MLSISQLYPRLTVRLDVQGNKAIPNSWSIKNPISLPPHAVLPWHGAAYAHDEMQRQITGNTELGKARPAIV